MILIKAYTVITLYLPRFIKRNGFSGIIALILLYYNVTKNSKV